METIVPTQRQSHAVLHMSQFRYCSQGFASLVKIVEVGPAEFNGNVLPQQQLQCLCAISVFEMGLFGEIANSLLRVFFGKLLIPFDLSVLMAVLCSEMRPGRYLGLSASLHGG